MARATSTALYRKLSTKATLSSHYAWWPIARTWGFREMGPQERISLLPPREPQNLYHTNHPLWHPRTDIFLINYFTCQKWRNYILPNFRAKVLWFILKRFLTIMSLPLSLPTYECSSQTYIHTCVYVTLKVFFLRSVHPEHIIYSVYNSICLLSWSFLEISVLLPAVAS